MSALCDPPQPRRSTQPLGWDWVTDWTDLESAVVQAESRVSWDWQRELRDLHRALDALQERVAGAPANSRR